MPRPIDRSNPANALIIADETVYFNNTPGVWRRITATCPDSNEVYVTLTNEMTLPPGCTQPSPALALEHRENLQSARAEVRGG